MTARQNYDLAVVGGGILGAATAAQAASRGARVVLFDGGVPGRAASLRSFAWLNAVSSEDPDYRALRVLGVQRHLLEQARWGSGSPYRFTGALAWVHDGAIEPVQGASIAVGIEQLARRDRAAGGAARLVDRAEAVRLEPGLRAVPHDGAFLYSGDEGWVDLPELVAELRRRLLRSGGVIVGTDAGLRLDGARARLIGEVDAGEIVIAAGAQTPALLGSLGVRLAARSTGAVLAVADGVADPPRGILRSGGVSARAHGAGTVLLQATVFDTLVDPESPVVPTPGQLQPLAAAAGDAFGWARPPRILHALAGARPVPGDGLPAIGRVPGIERLSVAFTHSGATLGLLLAELLAAELVEGPADDDRLERYRPGRLITAQ